MALTTDGMGDMPDVDAAVLDEALASDAFGKFAVLTASDGVFIQAGNDWQPGEACAAFLAEHGSDPWVLEYGQAGRLFRAAGQVSLEQVRRAFRSYLAGGSEWRDGFAWGEMVLAGTGPSGVVVAYRPDDGSILSEATYVGGVLHGPYRDFWRDGRLAAEGQYCDGLQEGERRFYDPDTGELREVLRFVAGREVVDWDAFFGRPRSEE